MKLLQMALIAWNINVAPSHIQKDAKAYYHDGLSNLNTQNYIQAVGDFTSAISLEPKYADAYLERAKAKKLLAEQVGFVSNELCVDLVQALSLGKKEAAALLESSCMGECYQLDNIQDVEYTFCIDLSNKKLLELPKIDTNLSNLLRLDLSENNINSINQEINALKNLMHLDISNNQLKKIESLGTLKALQELNLCNNQLESLPKDIEKLEGLKALYLRRNNLTSLDLTGLQSLEILDLSLNNMKSLPVEIEKLKNLKILNLVGNNISALEREHLKNQLKGCKIYFD